MSAPAYSLRLYTLSRDILWLFLKLYNRLEVRGAAHIPATGGVLLVANHVSFLDPPALGCAARHRVVRYMARDTLFENPLFGRLLRNVAAVPISRDRGDIGALKKAIAVLKAGDCLGLFPEGTRSSDGRLHPAKSGVGFLIDKAGVPVVPAFIDGTYRAFSRHHKWIRPYKVRVTFGPAIPPETFERFPDGRDRYERIAAYITEQIRKCSLQTAH